MCVKISKNELKELLSFSNEECGVVVEIPQSIAREKKKRKQNLSSSFARRQKKYPTSTFETLCCCSRTR